MTFYYTDHVKTNSSAVQDVYYNYHTLELAVLLTSSHGYIYSNVPSEVFDKFDAGGAFFSAGRYYAKTVKTEYGPGKAMGVVGYYDFTEDDSDDNYYRDNDYGPEFDTAAVGTPKGLTYAENAKVTTSGPYVNLSGTSNTVATQPALRRHTVNFTADGSLFSHPVHAPDVDAAVDALHEVAESLGLSVQVKEVITYFDN